MRQMKKCCVYLAIFVLVESCLVLRAPGAEATWPSESIFHSENLSRLGIGAVYDEHLREVQDIGFNKGMLEARSLYGLISLDVLPWLTLNGGAGQTEMKEPDNTGYQDGKSMWTAGAKASFWQHDLVDPVFLSCRCRLQAMGSYFSHDDTLYDKEFYWEEWRGALLVSAEFFVRDFGRDKTVYPYSTVFFVGPAFSDLEVEAWYLPGTTTAQAVAGREAEESRQYGAMLGFDLKLAHNLDVGWQGRIFDHTANNVSLTFHF